LGQGGACEEATSPRAVTSMQRLPVIEAVGHRACRSATVKEVLRRLRDGGQQFVRVEHVHVNDGGQAIVGNVKKQDAQG
jgi:hypothetical protein